MSIRNRLLTITAVSALAAATAVPAMALENEFHGMFRARGFVTNFAGTGSVALAKDTNSFVEQRTRLMYTAKASDDLKLVTHFEIDSRWGDQAYGTSRNVGGAVGADTTNLETKNVYLDFNLPGTKVNTKVGIMPWTDAYKGIFLNADAAGLLVSGNFAPVTGTFGYFRLNDITPPLPTGVTGGSGLGRADRDLFILDAKLSPAKNLALGAAYYYLHDDRVVSSNDIHTVGVNGEMKAGPATIDAFAVYQFGDAGRVVGGPERDLNAWAGQVAAKVGVGMGTIRVAGLYASGEQSGTTGDSSAFQNIQGVAANGSATAESSYFASDMLILMRSKWNINSDNAIVSSTNNGNQGIMGGFLGFDAKFSDKFNAAFNAGAIWVDKRVAGTGSATDDSKYLGTEVNAQLTYNLYSNMSASLQGAYVFLGDYFEGVGTGTPVGDMPDDPFLTSLMINYTF